MKWIWIIVGATALVTALAAAGVMPVGWYGRFLDPFPPLYQNLWLPILGASIMAGALALAWRRLLSERSRWERAGYLATIMVGGLVHLVGLVAVSRAGLTEPAWVARLDWAGGYFNDALRVSGEPQLFKRYRELRPKMSLHGRAHPPGPVAVNLFALAYFKSFPRHTDAAMVLARWMGADISALKIREWREEATWVEPPPPVEHDWQWAALTAVAWFVVLAAVLPAIFVYRIGRLLGDAREGLTAAALYLVVPAIGFFEPWWDLFYPTFTAAAAWMALKGFQASGPRANVWWLGAGFTLGVGLFFSYCQLAALGLLGCWALAEMWRRKEAWPLLKAGLAVFIGLAFAWEFVWAATGHNFVRDFPGAALQTWSVGAWTGEALPHYQRPYVTWLGANLVEFFCFFGLPLSILLARAACRRPAALGDTLAIGVLGGVLLLDLTGATRSEVARLWMFFMPVGAVAAMRALPAGVGPRLVVFAAVVAQGIIFKLTLTTNNIVN